LRIYVTTELDALQEKRLQLFRN